MSGAAGNPVEVAFDAEGVPILSTTDGLWWLGASGSWEAYPTPPPSGTGSLWRANDGTLWGDEGVGSWRLDPGSAEWVRVDGPSDAIGMHPIRQAEDGTLYSLCGYDPDFAGRSVRVCTRRAGEDWVAGYYVSLNAVDVGSGELFDDLTGAMIFGGQGGQFAARITPDRFEAYPLDFLGMFAVTADGNYLIGDSNYGNGTLIEVRPDGMARSWVDHGCQGDITLPYGCDGGVMDLVFAGGGPQLSPSGAAYQLRQSQNGAKDGALLRATPDGTQWQVVASGNPTASQALLLYISPNGLLVQLAFDKGVGYTAILDEGDIP